MKLAIVGATGMVGRKMLKVIEEHNVKIDELFLCASSHSVGKVIEFKGEKIKLQSIEDVLNENVDYAIFSAGGTVSKEWTPKFAKKGTLVIDNSSAWRMNEEIKLVVPEINGDALTSEDKIIANPNCSTIQLVAVLFPLHKKYGLERVVVSTYQSVTGSGKKAVDQLMAERKNEKAKMFYPHTIDLNCIPHGGNFLENGYTSEEMKLVEESRKILNLDALKITSTVVRVPVLGGHSESVNIEFKNEIDLKELKQILINTEGITVEDEPFENIYPMPINAEGMDDIFVGRIRKDFSKKNAVNLWIVSDNLRKGAATNAVQILEKLNI